MSSSESTGVPLHARLALHACCGPCLLEPYDALIAQGALVTVVYSNPNIHPREEYEHRRDTLLDYSQSHDIDVVELPYDPDVWGRAVEHAQTRAQRCSACYRVRLAGVARWAVAHGYDAVGTTLSVSPYQDISELNRVGCEVGAEEGIAFVERDFTSRYQEATRRSRIEGMYRQNYCGCAPSRVEAEQEREARRAARAKSR